MKIKRERTSGNHNDLVWAQMRYCPYWPAKLVETPPQMGRTPPKKTCVFFFGTKQFGFVELNKVDNYTQHREKYVKRGRGNIFTDAVKRIDDFISDPEKFRSNAFAQSSAKLKIKTENEIISNLGIKKEAVATNQAPKDSDKEKKLIDAMVALKKENQKITFDLKKNQEECVKLVSENSDLKQSAVATALEITKLESELSSLKSEHAEKMTECKKKSSELHSQNQTLSARIKQLQTAMAQNDQSENSTDDIYEVERILDEKKVGKVQHYLVRWKGFGPNDDSWERKSDLSCPAILREYLESKKNN